MCFLKFVNAIGGFHFRQPAPIATTLTFVRLAFSSNLFCVKSIKPIPCKKNIALDVASRVRLTIYLANDHLF